METGSFTGINALLDTGEAVTWNSCHFRKEEIELPSGLKLYYPKLVATFGEHEFSFAGKQERLYGGKLLENIIQALAREITMQAGVRIVKRLGEDLALQVHDELVFVVPECKVNLAKTVMAEEMCRRPSWAPGWPLAVDEPKTGRTYGEVK